MRPRSPRDQLVRRALAVALSAALAGLLGGCGLLPRPHIERVTIIPASLGTSSRAVATIATDSPGNAGLTFRYQWMKNGAPIPGEERPSLDLALPGGGDRGDAISVVVTASGTLLSSEPHESAAVTVEPQVLTDARRSTERYAMEGADSATLFASIRDNGPRDGDQSASGLAHFSLARTLAAVQSADGCAIDRLVLRETVVVTLPDAPTSTLSPDLQAKVDRFRQAVETHEDRHVQIRQAYLAEIVAALEAAPPAPDCEALEAEVSRIMATGLQRERLAQDRFHEEERVRLRAACAVFEAQLGSLAAQFTLLEGQPARYNALIPDYNALVDDYNWCGKS